MKFWNRITDLIRSNRAMVFVDYEYWFYSYRNLYGMKPDLASWIGELRKEYHIVDVRVFADFSLAGLFEEKKKVLAVTDSVQDTTEESVYRKKDMTDFVMLDSLYQSVNEDRNIGTYILFTGDGHFTSVVNYITKQKREES
ncbi:MAG: NYN domain-containing protein [Oscillospiraceae bacterium]|nr:NYN domain-containing protein [Oscillospiraceae bacterium]MBR2894199.1 NYN domain-containing protein [Oscillospiraceae bacterium]